MKESRKSSSFLSKVVLFFSLAYYGITAIGLILIIVFHDLMNHLATFYLSSDLIVQTGFFLFVLALLVLHFMVIGGLIFMHYSRQRIGMILFLSGSIGILWIQAPGILAGMFHKFYPDLILTTIIVLFYWFFPLREKKRPDKSSIN